MNTETLLVTDTESEQDERLSNWSKHQVYMTNDEMEINHKAVKFNLQFFGIGLFIIFVLALLTTVH